MPLTKPSVLKVWQERPQLDRQPTCHDRRNPVAPWLALEQDSDEAIEDRQFARAWATTRSSQTLASQIHPDEGVGQRPRKQPAAVLDVSANAHLPSAVAITSVTALIEQAIAALPHPAARKPARSLRKERDAGDH